MALPLLIPKSWRSQRPYRSHQDLTASRKVHHICHLDHDAIYFRFPSRRLAVALERFNRGQSTKCLESYSFFGQVHSSDGFPQPEQTPFSIGPPQVLHGEHPHFWHIFNLLKKILSFHLFSQNRISIGYTYRCSICIRSMSTVVRSVWLYMWIRPIARAKNLFFNITKLSPVPFYRDLSFWQIVVVNFVFLLHAEL